MGFGLLRTRESWAWLIAAALGAFVLYQQFALQHPVEQDAPVALRIDALIAQVKHDLESAEEARLKEGKAPLFEVDTFDLEIHFGVRRSASSTAGVRLEVVTLDGRSEAMAERSQKITLHMKAVDYGQGGSIPASSPPIRVR